MKDINRSSISSSIVTSFQDARSIIPTEEKLFLYLRIMLHCTTNIVVLFFFFSFLKKWKMFTITGTSTLPSHVGWIKLFFKSVILDWPPFKLCLYMNFTLTCDHVSGRNESSLLNKDKRLRNLVGFPELLVYIVHCDHLAAFITGLSIETLWL